MWPKLLIVAACLYLGNAAVETNIYEGEESAAGDALQVNQEHAVPTVEETFVDVSHQEGVERQARSCGQPGCTNHCRRLGHARGVCIGTYCQCRSRLARSADLEEESPEEDAPQVNQESAIPAVEEAFVDESHQERVERQARSCGQPGCTNHCRRLGHARGVCIGTYCQCRSRLARSADLEEEYTFEDNQIIPTNDVTNPSEVEVVPRSDCNPNWCDHNCRRNGFTGGACVNGRCKCDIQRSAVPAVPAAFAEDEDTEENEGEAESRQVRRCNPSQCAQICRRLGFRLSRCSNGRCFCWN